MLIWEACKLGPGRKTDITTRLLICVRSYDLAQCSEDALGQQRVCMLFSVNKIRISRFINPIKFRRHIDESKVRNWEIC